MNYKVEVDKLLEKNMTERGYKLWLGINTVIPDIWDRPSSSGGKYHKKEGGRIHDIAEHTFEMLYSGIKILRMLDVRLKSSRCDALLFSIGLHDRLKYGEHGELKHTTGKHDQLIGNLIRDNKSTFEKILTIDDMIIMEEAARFHSGRWSTDVGRKNQNSFEWSEKRPETMFVHMLDMLSSQNCLK